MKGGKPRSMLYFLSARFSGKEIHTSWRPNMDVYEADQAVVVSLEIPGVRPEDIEIMQYADRLQVSGVRRPGSGETPKRFQQIEIVCGQFEKEIILPLSLRGAPVEAALSLGILSLRISKETSGGAGVQKRIEIEAQ
ncbi:MAG: Hsp20/alpha crystallin family protein [Planctomycetes bacterium]|nr:Hsp20/alpha crystallin family protein [Planctomycetota bacterium]